MVQVNARYIELRDWQCEGAYQGRTCNRVLLAYDPVQVTLVLLKATQQVKCSRCGHLNGIDAINGRRIPRR